MKFAKMMSAAVLLTVLAGASGAFYSRAAQADRATLKGSAPAWANSRGRLTLIQRRR